ncbi:MAG: NAD(P)-dependent oxidoreductase, partial [Comamonadaceae bacterium]
MVQAGATAAASAQEVVDRARVVFTSLPSPAVFSAVMLGEGGVSGGKAVKVVVDLSTVGSRATRAAAAGLRAKDIELVDAPVSGGAAGAKAGTLAIMVAGQPAAVADVKDLLESFGKLFMVGPDAGQAQLLKLLNNMLSSTAFAITSEAYVAGVKGGLDPQVMMAAINAGSGRSGASQDKFMKQVLPGS